MRSPVALSLALVLSLASCGGSGDPKEDGFAALNSGDHAAALASFSTALEGLTADAADYVEVAVARCRAQAHIDPEQSVEDFKALADKISDLKPSDYREVVTELLAADDGASSAVTLMDLGCKRFPDSEKMIQTRDTVIATVKKRGDKGAMSALDGMGYLGGD